MIDGLSHLLTMRKAGLRPQSLMLSIDCPFRKPTYKRDFEAMELTVHDSVSLDDFRAFVGLPVTLYAPVWNQLASDTLEKLKKYASEITVLCADFGDEIGYFWRPETGVIELDDYRWVKQYHSARVTSCFTKEEHKKRVALEEEAKANLPGLEEKYGKFAV